ncbi:hypothetical protein [Kingella sp. (in: b-proteobacteria)]|nr:hypothetical protein [Kingella sp. (in: b-proteobacteria)]MDO4657620.1 hypothetical protein [Kingella sp. (in: b-proteobacteria)]
MTCGFRAMRVLEKGAIITVIPIQKNWLPSVFRLPCAKQYRQPEN